MSVQKVEAFKSESGLYATEEEAIRGDYFLKVEKLILAKMPDAAAHWILGNLNFLATALKGYPTK